MRKAIIDLGTNTFNLLIADIKIKEINFLVRKKMEAKLGSGSINKGIITKEAISRALKILNTYQKIITEYKVTNVQAIATSAVRSASNGQDFVNRVRKEIGIEIDVISGIQEANLIYQGVKHAYQKEDTFLILDIGGGSTEFIAVKNNQLVDLQSFNLGIARLIDRFKPSDPISPKEIETIFEYLSKELSPFLESIKEIGVRTLIGSSGSFDTLISLIAHRFKTPNDIEKEISNNIKLSDFEEIYNLLIASTLSERKAMKGMDLMRVEMMVLAIIFIQFIKQSLDINKMVQTQYALKEGALFR